MGRLVKVVTRFDIEARRPGGVPLETAVAKGSRAIASLQSSIEDEVNLSIDTLLELSAVSRDAGTIAQIYDLACGLHDIGDLAGRPLVTLVAGEIAGTALLLQAGSQCPEGLLDCFLSALSLARSDEYKNARLEDVPQLVEGIAQISVAMRPAGDAAGEHET